MRRPRARLVTLLPGGPGSPSVPTMRGCLEWLDAARTKAGESLPDRGPRRAPSAPGSYGPGDRKAAVERREAPALRKEARQDGKTRCAAWRSTPSVFRRGNEKGRRPRAVKKQGRRCTPAFARGFGGLIDNCIGKTSARQSRFPLPSWERVPSEARRVRGRNSRKMPHPHPARASLSLRAIHPLPQGERGKKKRREE